VEIFMRVHAENETQIDTDQPAMPETVSAELAEIAGEMREGLPAVLARTGLRG
jgi:hypothetical protein